mgnify:CR=1 FL=1
MKFEEARKALIDGKRIRRRDWQENKFICLDIDLLLRDENNITVNNYGVFFSKKYDQWELYEEPFKTQTLKWFKPEDKMPKGGVSLIVEDINDVYFVMKRPFLDDHFKIGCKFWAYLEDEK